MRLVAVLLRLTVVSNIIDAVSHLGLGTPLLIAAGAAGCQRW
ncbi:hypothetical protein [Streptomyces sp. NPDC058424]